MAEAKHVALVVLIVAVIVALATFISKQPGGWIETAEASVCSWRTAGDPTTNRVVKLSCSCPGKDEVKYSALCKLQHDFLSYSSNCIRMAEL